tara:strand:- start:327 stop:827 length:501 start_codon:yes stop_codon:yes gene_type:complete
MTLHTPNHWEGVAQAALTQRKHNAATGRSALVRLTETSIDNNCFNCRSDMRLLLREFGIDVDVLKRGEKITKPAKLLAAASDGFSAISTMSSAKDIEVRFYRTAKRGEKRMSIGNIKTIGLKDGDLLFFFETTDGTNQTLCIQNLTQLGKVMEATKQLNTSLGTVI